MERESASGSSIWATWASHANQLLAGKIPRAELTAVADMVEARLDAFPSLQRFNDAEAMFASGAVNAVLIATPHDAHTVLGIAALVAGLHVMVEKPISVHKANGERLIATHTGREDKQVFAAMFNLGRGGRGRLAQPMPA